MSTVQLFEVTVRADSCTPRYFCSQDGRTREGTKVRPTGSVVRPRLTDKVPAGRPMSAATMPKLKSWPTLRGSARCLRVVTGSLVSTAKARKLSRLLH